GLERALPGGERALETGPFELLQGPGVAAPEVAVPLPGDDRVLDAVQAVVDLPQNGVDLGRGARRALLGELEIETGEGELAAAAVGRRQLREDAPVLLGEGVRLLQDLGCPAGVSGVEVDASDPAQLGRGCGGRGRSRRGRGCPAARGGESAVEIVRRRR